MKDIKINSRFNPDFFSLVSYIPKIKNNCDEEFTNKKIRKCDEITIEIKK